MNPLHALALSLTPAQPLTPHPHWAPTADRPAPANPAAYTKGTSHHRGGCRAPASGSTDAPHMARDRAPPRLAVCEDGEWRDRRPRLLSPQRPRSFHYQASVSEHGAGGRHPRALASSPRKRGSSRRSSCVGHAVRAVLPLPLGEGGGRVQTVAAGRTRSDPSIPHPSTATSSAMIGKSAAASAPTSSPASPSPTSTSSPFLWARHARGMSLCTNMLVALDWGLAGVGTKPLGID